MVINPRLDQLYQQNILAVNQSLSKRTKVTAVLPETVVDCPNCVYDRVRQTSSGRYNGTGPTPFNGPVCPVCKGKGKVTTVATRRLPGANFRFGSSSPGDPRVTMAGDLPEDMARMKINVRFRSVLEAADYFVVSGVGYELNYRRVGEVRNRGLLTEVISEITLQRES